MRILIYKRTHRGDPDAKGIFGICDCMGRVRGWKYDAVIGVGGTGPDPQNEGIAGKITWVGIGPREIVANGRGPLIAFNHFLLYDKMGPSFLKAAPHFAARMYKNNIRAVVLDRNCHAEYMEARKIIDTAKSAPASKGLVRFLSLRTCGTNRLVSEQYTCYERTELSCWDRPKQNKRLACGACAGFRSIL